jgi:hypothetical protein
VTWQGSKEHQKKTYPMAGKLEEPAFAEQMNTNETIFSHYLNLPSPG